MYLIEVFTLPHGSYQTPIGVRWDYWSLLGVYWESNGTGSLANLLPNGESNPSPIGLPVDYINIIIINKNKNNATSKSWTLSLQWLHDKVTQMI